VGGERTARGEDHEENRRTQEDRVGVRTQDKSQHPRIIQEEVGLQYFQTRQLIYGTHLRVYRKNYQTRGKDTINPQA